MSRKRLHALWLVRCGASVREAVARLGVGYSTLGVWLSWYRAGGLDAVLRRTPGEYAPRAALQLDPALQRTLVERARAGAFRDYADACAWLWREHGVAGTYPWRVHVARTPRGAAAGAAGGWRVRPARRDHRHRVRTAGPPPPAGRRPGRRAILTVRCTARKGVSPYSRVTLESGVFLRLRWTEQSAGGVRCGGRGGIRTPEAFYRLHDFQSCALGQTMRPFHWSSAVIGGHRRSSAYSIVKNAPDNKRCGEILGVQRRWRSQSRHQHPTPFQRERFFVGPCARACPQLRRMTEAARWTAARKLRLVLS